MKRRVFLQQTLLGFGGLAAGSAFAAGENKKPNVLWILAEDASPHLGCYGETAISTPHLDALAAEGVRFENAFVTCPVCSPCRSALATGMYQTTIGSHNHRSQHDGPKGGGNTAYYDSYRLPEAIPLISDLFRAAGYYTCNGAWPEIGKKGKTDYNFMTDHAPYDGSDFRKRPAGKPFFAQIQIKGGKSRPEDFEAGEFRLPPYYPEDDLLRRDWAEYLGCWEKMDKEAGDIIAMLKAEGLYENTLIVFLTDHGISHARDKQFLYEGGIRVPMIVRFPDGRMAGTVRNDLALQIDLAPLSLAFAGIPVPDRLQGRDIFAEDYEERESVVAARDRCDETIDIIRAVRTPKYKYIRNFLSYRPHMQYSQYKDAKDIVQRLRQLHGEGKLTPLQDRIFNPTRPPEELYDLEADPYETENLAGNKDYEKVLRRERKRLYDWMLESRDPGLIPEPVLEDMGKAAGSKFAAMARPESRELITQCIEVIEAGEGGNREYLRRASEAADGAVRYWAVTWLGVLKDAESQAVLEKAAGDPVHAVRVAAHLALCRLGLIETHLAKLAEYVGDENLITGMYAMNAIEQTGVLNKTVKAAAEKAIESPYEFTLRYGKRLVALCNKAGVKG